MRRKTAKDRLMRAVRGIDDWCRRNRHLPMAVQWRTLCRKVRGHYAYYGICRQLPGAGPVLLAGRGAVAH